MTLGQAIELANALHRRGRTAEAIQIYQQILSVSPDNADALHYLGLCRFEQGAADEGIALVRRALAIAPDFADAHNNLGNMLRIRGDLDQAALSYERAIALRPDSADAINNLGTTLKARGQLDEAVAMFERALALNPEHVPTLNNLGNVLVRVGKQNLALDHFRKALMLAPYDGRAYYRLGYALSLENRLADAAEIYRRWMELEPDKPEPRHLLAACTGQDVPERASKEFVERLFDRFAPSFDAVLDTLNTGPRRWWPRRFERPCSRTSEARSMSWTLGVELVWLVRICDRMHGGSWVWTCPSTCSGRRKRETATTNWCIPT